MKASAIRERESDDLVNLEKELRRELWQARVDNFTSQLDSTAKISSLKRDIARIKTILTQRQAQQPDPVQAQKDGE